MFAKPALKKRNSGISEWTNAGTEISIAEKSMMPDIQSTILDKSLTSKHLEILSRRSSKSNKSRRKYDEEKSVTGKSVAKKSKRLVVKKKKKKFNRLESTSSNF